MFKEDLLTEKNLPGTNEDYFSLLKINRDFQLDLNKLRKTFFSLQEKYHPDRFAMASKQEKLLAQRMTVQVNDAYVTLKDPRKRAEYLLVLEGVSQTKLNESIRDPEFLILQLSLHEKLESLIEAGSSIEALELFLTDIKRKFRDVESIFSQSYREKSLLASINAFQKMRFYERLMETINREIDRIDEQ